MDEAAAGALEAQAVDRLGDLHLHLPRQAQLRRGELAQTGGLDQALAEHEAAIPEQDLLSLGFDSSKVALVDSAILVDEAMVRRHQQIADVGPGQFFDQADQLP